MLYFVQDEATLNIKIGFTGNNDVRERINVLQTGCPSRLMLLGISSGTIQDERRLHQQFQHARLQGEWFRPVPELLRFLIYAAGVEFAERACARAANFLFHEESRRKPTIDDLLEELRSRGAFSSHDPFQ